mmetsp:Transcript_2896/g.5366  ORF Transcript_2896/g.5366 Transcript_2896/m.5366 type:complete len:282 (-) Transcript_2896:353-1198(-)
MQSLHLIQPQLAFRRELRQPNAQQPNPKAAELLPLDVQQPLRLLVELLLGRKVLGLAVAARDCVERGELDLQRNAPPGPHADPADRSVGPLVLEVRRQRPADQIESMVQDVEVGRWRERPLDADGSPRGRLQSLARGDVAWGGGQAAGGPDARRRLVVEAHGYGEKEVETLVPGQRLAQRAENHPPLPDVLDCGDVDRGQYLLRSLAYAADFARGLPADVGERLVLGHDELAIWLVDIRRHLREETHTRHPDAARQPLSVVADPRSHLRGNVCFQVESGRR